MPLPMVHLAVAHALKDEAFTGSDKAAYFLGSNAPDSIHKREGWRGQDKLISHLKVDLPEENKHALLQERILALWNEKSGDASADSFLAGYCVHLLTDMVWNEYLYRPFYKPAYEADPNPAQDIKAAYYNDTDLADLELYRSESWRPEVFALLASQKGRSLQNLVFAPETEAWRDHILNFYDNMDLNRYQPVRYILPEHIRSFIQSAADLIREIMK